MKNRLNSLLMITGMASLAFLIEPANAQSYPERYIRIVNPYTSGGPADTILRLIAPKMEDILGQKLVIENKPGAAGNIGTLEVANSPADGYTVLMAATNNLVINQFISKLPIDPMQKLKPVAKIVDVPIVLFSNPAVRAKTFSEFLAYTKANPGKVNYGTPGVGTVNHLLIERLKLLNGADILHIPYRGAAPGILAVMQNDIQLFAVGLVAGASLLKEGKITAIAVAAPRRLNALPEVPTLSEAGATEFSAANWWALAVPVGTSDEIIFKLRTALNAALSEDAVRRKLEALGLVIATETPNEFLDRLTEESALWADIAKRANITMD